MRSKSLFTLRVRRTTTCDLSRYNDVLSPKEASAIYGMSQSLWPGFYSASGRSSVITRAMKVVLRHKLTGRYYQSPGKWVRRADNALAFDAVVSARRFSRLHQLSETQPVHRLAPYLMPLLNHRGSSIWESWLRGRSGQWYCDRAKNFGRN
jgi:hypothetical protein